MFAGNLMESTQRTVHIKNIDPDILRIIIAYAYNADFFIPRDRVLQLMITADLLQMMTLRQECSAFIELQLHPDNCLGVKAIAELHGCSSLLNACLTFAFNNFEQIVACEEFLSLPLNQLIDLVSRDELRVAHEEQVYHSLLRWVNSDLETRREQFPELLSHVRLPFVSLQFFSDVVEQEALIKDEERCQEYLHEAYLYKNSPDKRSLLRHSSRSRLRKIAGMDEMILTVGGMCKEHPISTVELYNSSQDYWSALSQMDTARFGLGACFHNGCVYAIGGYSQALGYLDSVECYSVRDNTWMAVTSMNQPRRYHSVYALFGLIYATGGQNSQGILSSAERLDPDANTWTSIEGMNVPRMYHGMAELDSHVYVVGGHSGHIRLNSVEYYVPSCDTWTHACSMSTPRSVAGVASMGDSIYVAGGYDGKVYLNSVECYDKEKNGWSVCPSMNTRRSAMGLVVHQRSLYACGGFNGSFESSVEKYDSDSRNWKLCAEMLIEKVHFGVAST